MISTVKYSISRAGGVAAIAKLFGIKPVSIYEWIARGAVPADKCPEIEKFTLGVVRCEELNADIDWAYLRGTASLGKPSR